MKVNPIPLMDIRLLMSTLSSHATEQITKYTTTGEAAGAVVDIRRYNNQSMHI